jgi:hypothetical protein
MEINIYNIAYQIQTLFNNYKGVKLIVTKHVLDDRNFRFNTEFSITELIIVLKKIVDKKKRVLNKELPLVYTVSDTRALRTALKWEDNKTLVLISAYVFFK